MKIITSIIAVFLMISATANEPVPSPGKAANSGIEFHQGSWDEALKLARETGKPVFLDISASWCGPCNALKKTTFPNEEVGVFYNENFINVLVDGDKGEGIDLAKEFRVSAYPSMLFLNSKGELIARTSGYRDPQNFIALGQQVLEQ
ncbi:MAG: thioredoxin family protein [Bacteroidales bacterium]|nr:thioredoxin family protein [Bacteroidales bacterium]MDT8430124.1 thioredoxin family protein [Bacteroidales bacterium]